MNTLTLSRWQFGITTVYHFLFVPLTIGLSLIVAGMQTVWYRTGDAAWRRMTRFFGAIFLINFAMGVVTGIVQEFQFGMNWSAYSRFVGDIFGAPLAMEGLIAFFLESTFLGLWIFGWDRLSPRLHLATIWLAALGTVLSMYFILAANSWMQHPVGYRINPVTNRAEPTSIWKVLSNSTAIVTFLHTFAASLLTAGMFVLGISAWKLLRDQDRDVFRPAAHVALVLSFVASVAVAFSGHAQAQVMTRQQPMKMAAAEALWGTKPNASFSLFAIGDVSKGRNKVDISIPDGLSLLATNSHERHRRGHQRRPGRGGGEVRSGRLQADHRRRLLVVPLHGRHRLPAGRAVPRRAWCSSAGDVWSSPVGCSRSSCGPSPCLCWGTASAGCSPRWVANRGSCTACSRPVPRCRRGSVSATWARRC